MSREQIEPDDPAGGRFHIDKRVPVALILAIGVQTGGAIWWASSTQAALSMLAADQRRAEMRIDKLESLREDIGMRLTRVEVQITGQSEMLQRILRSVERDHPN